MIYLDTSAALAHLLAEDRRPPAEIWSRELVASKLLEYELYNRLNARGLAATHGDLARRLLARVALVALRPEVLERALDPFPVPVRTLDALHLASVTFLVRHGKEVEIATYDQRLAEAAQAMGLALAPL